MIKYITESDDDITMDVQVGPGEEIEAEMEEPVCNPVDMAKKNPENVPVVQAKNEDGLNEYYVDASDIINLANLNECSMLEALNQVIACDESGDLTCNNIITVFSEADVIYMDELVEAGALCAVDESEDDEDDIEIDVQVGPNEEEMKVSEDPQTANPLDCVKREYENVIVAKADDKFFMDVEDVQKCADINCESVIETLNGIIGVYEDADINTGNIVVLVNEDTDPGILRELDRSGVVMEASIKEMSANSKLIVKVGKMVRSFLLDHGCAKAATSTKYIGGENAKFCRGSGKRMLISIINDKTNAVYTRKTINDNNRYRMDAVEDAIKCINDNKAELTKKIEGICKGYKVASLNIREGRLGVINLAISFK